MSRYAGSFALTAGLGINPAVRVADGSLMYNPRLEAYGL